jgi:hypothetical protein
MCVCLDLFGTSFACIYYVCMLLEYGMHECYVDMLCMS